MYYMETTNVLTIKGTTTIPASIRRALKLQPGSMLRFSLDSKTKNIIITPEKSLDEVAKANIKMGYKVKPADIQASREGWARERV